MSLGGCGNTPEARPTGRSPVSTEILARPAHRFLLYRIYPDGTEELASEHLSFGEGWRAGTRAVTITDKKQGYSLYRGDRRIARFAHNRLMSRFGADRASTIVEVL
jgi:hypothetical protein